MTHDEPHVVVAGGGPAGAAAAVGLARRGVRVTVLETSQGPQPKVGECLPPAAGPLLDELGLAGRMAADGHSPTYGNRSVWGDGRPADRDFVFDVWGAGWHLDRRGFEAALASAAYAAGAAWRYSCRVVGCDRQARSWELTLATPLGSERLAADFLIDATGRPARLARHVGARRVRYDRLVGVAAVLAPSPGVDPDGSRTLVESVPSGWWYSAPVPGGGLAVAYMTDADRVKAAGLSSPTGWHRMLALAPHTARRAAGRLPTTIPHVAPADTSRLDAVAGPGWLAVGDAAAAYDPLTSYGLTAALGTGLHAAAVAGRETDAAGYSDLLDRAFAACRTGLRERYELEQRWPTELFWRRRHGSG